MYIEDALMNKSLCIALTITSLNSTDINGTSERKKNHSRYNLSKWKSLLEFKCESDGLNVLHKGLEM